MTTTTGSGTRSGTGTASASASSSTGKSGAGMVRSIGAGSVVIIGLCLSTVVMLISA